MQDQISGLEGLTGYDKLRLALESGDPHRIYRALWWGKLRGSFRGNEELVNRLLANRRLFLKPVKSAPTMFTLNGIGATVYGQSDHDASDGTYIGTHFFTFVFLPIFPLGQYLCTSSGNQYQFFGAVPVSSLVYLWRRLLGVLLVIGIAIAAFASIELTRHNDVTVVNGLDYPVEVSLSGVKVSVDPQSFTTQRLELGATELVVLGPGGKIIQKEAFTLDNSDVVACNVLGAGFLYEQKIPYTASDRASRGQQIPDPEVFCGEWLIVRNNVDFRFQEPAEQISFSSELQVAWRTHFDFAGGWRHCSSHLSLSGEGEKAVAMAAGQADLDSLADLALTHTVIARVDGKDGALDWIEKELAEHDGVELHRFRQNLYTDAGRYDEMRVIYEDRYQKDPDSADAAYLRTRTLRRNKALAELADARRRWPEHSYLRRSQAWHLQGSRQYGQALPLWAAISEVEPAISLGYQVEALVGLGRKDEAIALLQARGPEDFDEIVTLGRLALLSGLAPDPASYEQLDGATRAWFFARLSGDLPPALLDQIEEPGARAAVEITAQLHRDGRAALELLRNAPEATLEWLDLTSDLLLLGEAMQTNDSDLAQPIEAKIRSAGYAKAARYCRGEGSPEDLENLPLAVCAAVRLAASMGPGVGARQARELRQEARLDDVLSTVVSHALDNWTFQGNRLDSRP